MIPTSLTDMRIFNKGAIPVTVALSLLLGIVSPAFATTPMPHMRTSSSCSDGYCLTTNNCGLPVDMQVGMLLQLQRYVSIVLAPPSVEVLPTEIIQPPETSA